jgi:hypothetical protein
LVGVTFYVVNAMEREVPLVCVTAVWIGVVACALPMRASKHRARSEPSERRKLMTVFMGKLAPV